MLEGLLKLIAVETVDSNIKESITIETGADIGRSSDCDITLNDSTLSRVHCRISIDGGRYVVEDMKSRNGTIVNKSSIKAPIELKDGDEIVIGKNVFRVEITPVDSTMSYDSVSLSEDRKDTTSFHDSQNQANKFSGPSPVSMELDRRLIDEYMDENDNQIAGKKFSCNPFGWFNEKVHFSSIVLKTHKFVKKVTPKELQKIPAWRNFVVFTLLFCIVSSASIYVRITTEESGYLSLFYPSSMISIFMKAVIMGGMLFFSFLAVFFILASLSRKILKFFHVCLTQQVFNKTAIICLSPVLILITAGAVIAVLTGESSFVILELLRLLGVVVMVLASFYFYFLLLSALTQLTPGMTKENRKRFYTGFLLIFLLSFPAFGIFIYSIDNWRNLYESSSNWEADFQIAKNLLDSEKYLEAEQKLGAMVRYSNNLSDREKAETSFWLGVMKFSNKKEKEGEKDIKTGFFYADKEQKNLFYGILEKFDIHEEIDFNKYKNYMKIDGSHKKQDDVVAQIILDIDKYDGKNLQINKMLYEKFGFDVSSGFENSDAWFTHAETVILEPTELMEGKAFRFYYHPPKEDREARKFVMTYTGKNNKSFYIESLRGKLIKHETADGHVMHIFLIRELEINYKKYKGELPADITKSVKGS